MSFSTGLFYADNRVNTPNSDEIGMKMHAFIRWGKFHKQNELEIENFDNLKQVMKINNKNVILVPFQVFSRFSSISQRNITVAESLAYELTVFPMNLFDSEGFSLSGTMNICQR